MGFVHTYIYIYICICICIYIHTCIYIFEGLVSQSSGKSQEALRPQKKIYHKLQKKKQEQERMRQLHLKRKKLRSRHRERKEPFSFFSFFSFSREHGRAREPSVRDALVADEEWQV